MKLHSQMRDRVRCFLDNSTRREIIDTSTDNDDPTWWKVTMHRVRQATLRKDSYNPVKRPQDSVDQLLLGALELPAHLVTHDRPLIDQVRQADPSRIPLVLTLEQFVESVTAATLPPLGPSRGVVTPDGARALPSGTSEFAG